MASRQEKDVGQLLFYFWAVAKLSNFFLGKYLSNKSKFKIKNPHYKFNK